MGGLNSTRWGEYLRKLTVEECLCLDVNMLVKDGFIQLGYRESGVLIWTNQILKIDLAKCDIEADSVDTDDSCINLDYQTGAGNHINEDIFLIATVPNYGGIRWWFECPDCGRKAVKLYMGHKPYFKCRKCLNLTYNSCQNSRSPHDLWEQLARQTSVRHGIPYKMVKKVFREQTLKVGRRFESDS